MRILATTFLLLMLSACGGGGGGDSSSSSSASGGFNTVLQSVNLSANSVSVYVGADSSQNANTLYVSVTICQPNTTNCVTVDNVLLDTGSTGLRVLASAVSSLQLNPVTVKSAPIIECASFISGSAWGPVKLADVKMSSELASSIPIQILADPSYSSIPSACGGSQGTEIASTIKTNGILGVGLFVNDSQNYFNCVPTTLNNCRISLSSSLQVQNPVSAFKVDNNGVIVKLPSISASGASLVTGSLTFGIDTQSNNSSAGSNVIPTDSYGNFTTYFNNTTYTYSFIDSGSNALFFPSGSLSSVLVPCSSSTVLGFYCPSATQSYTASLTLKNKVQASVDFSAANAETLVASRNSAFTNLTGQIGNNLFDWGLPFFYGRSVYIGITGRSSNAGTGPYYAYTN
jgi:hypothetical protein